MNHTSLPRNIINRVTGESVTFIKTAQETNSAYLWIEVALPPHGEGPPLHIHDEFEEEFECLTGILTVTIGKKKIQLQEGEKALVPKLTPHTFSNLHDEPLVFRVKLTPPSRFEESIRIHYGLMDDGFTDRKGRPKSLLHTALILSLQNTWIAGIPIGLQRCLVTFLIHRGHKKNVYKDLQRYISMGENLL
ncbi:MAG: cupin domain-containing protein [Leadbetterella sp.]|nr:cupin domain-containing protein [Leadbetterella sp.]